MNQPDPYSMAWWRQQMKGVTHSINRCNAEYASAADLIEALTKRVDSLENSLEDARAEIGRLRDEIEDKFEKVREAYRELKNGS